MNQGRKIKNLLGDTFVFALGSFGSKLILFFLVPLYTNVLSTEEYGTADLVITVGQLLMPFTSLVVADAVLRFGLEKGTRREDVLVSGCAVVAAGSVVTAAVTPLFGLYGDIAQWRWYLFGYVVASMFNQVGFTYLKVADKNRLYALMSVLQAAVLATLNYVLLVVVGTGVEGYLLSNIAAVGGVFVVLFFAGGLHRDCLGGHLDKALTRRMLVYSAPLVLNNVSWWVMQSADRVIVSAFAGAAALGLYTAAVKIPSLINTLTTIFSQAWGVSSIRELEGDNDTAFYSNVFYGFSALSFAACIAVTAITKPFMSVYVGADFFESWRYVPLLLVAATFGSVSSFFGAIYGALKLSVGVMRTTLVSAAVNLALCFALTPFIGVWGAVVATLVAYVVIAHARMFGVLRYVKFDIRAGKYFANVVIVVAQALLVSADLWIAQASIAAAIAFAFVNKELGAVLVSKFERRGER